MNFNSQEQEDDVTPFFNHNRQQCTIFDDLSEKESQKSVFNMFKENVHDGLNGSVGFNGYLGKDEDNGTKCSKQSIIDGLNDYDFRERFDVIEREIS